ncbi:MAG: DegT/DnrJ/EryC1/StrS family aminotransferase [Methanocalculus sp. MSAO_Arc1]|uniref:DegT/DnrJ/EryC1/StrS family aminotransferase n=1 Tax=Methanocalculus sp. MSAO_Arc1 TaxID=2293854 RepID=UPI000FEE7BC6|nr:DegT/DnrJ/EryC1/StrS family aminotransferase [Methanocalculus sp. MSAO_Arc1]RQD81819.1 MAG: DegT/DnrJ/EryC1/StrS family aminotransferase [Methanocalculus sp. MSAO_Arc1]
MQIPIARPSIGQEEQAAVASVLASGIIAEGPVTKTFENEFAKYCGAAYAVAVNNGTAALHAALLAAGVGPGDEVIVPAFTFFATASSVSMTGAKPVFADVLQNTCCIDPASVPELITPATKAVIGVHLYGQPCDAFVLREICSDQGLVFIEDAAQAHGAMINGAKVGSIGDLACFSFYATKNLATGEGGMVTTGSVAFHDRLRRIINHGQSEKYIHTEIGYNYRMTDIAAAIGRVQLSKLDGFIQARQENAAYFNEHIRVPGVLTPGIAPGCTPVWHQYAIRVTDDAPLSREALMAYLKEKGIGSAIHYPVPLHRQPVYEAGITLPVAEELAASVLSLPVHPAVGEAERKYIVDCLNEVVS